MSLFAFRTTASGKVALHEVFMLEQATAKQNMQQASIARDAFSNAISKCAENNAPNPAAVIEAAHQYLPFVVALTEQIHMTANKNMSQPLVFQWTSALAPITRKYDVGLFEDELASVYAVFAIAHYQGAALALADQFTPPEMRHLSKDKVAIALLKKAAGIFSYMTDTLLPLSTLHSSVRPIETIAAASQALYHLCLANIQELIVAAAIKSKKSHGAIAKLCVGIQEKFAKVQESLADLKQLWHQLSPEFKAYPRVKIGHYKSLSSFHMGKNAAAESKHGVSIAYLQMAKDAIKEIRFPESYTSHLTLTEMYRDISQLNATVDTLLESAKKDNDTIYFELVPSPADLELPKGILMAKAAPFEPIAAIPESFFDV